MTYRALPVTQRDGSELADSNCRMAAGATGLDFDTLGGQTSTGAKMRERSGDTGGGTTSDDIDRAWDSYGQSLRIRDGRTWADALDELRAGRLVHIDVWSATCGGPCCKSACGHTMAIAPEQNGEGKWLVSDPWCSPPSWKWWAESKLRAGAEEWADRCGYRSSQAGGPRDIRELAREVLLAIVRELMGRWTPSHPLDPGDDDYVPGTLGDGAPIMYTSTEPHPEGADVSINLTGIVTSGHLVDVPEGVGFYADAALSDRMGTIGTGGRTLPYLGRVNGEDAWAVVISTAHPYSDGVKRPTCCYVPRGSGPDPYDAPPIPGGDIPARDAEWRAWLETDTGAPDR